MLLDRNNTVIILEDARNSVVSNHGTGVGYLSIQDLGLTDRNGWPYHKLGGGKAGEAPEGRKALARTSLSPEYVVVDQAYEGDETHQLVRDLGLTPIVPPKCHRREAWAYD